MADESILSYRKPGFPKTSNSEKSYRITIEYIGPYSTLASAEPASNDAWGEYDGRVATTDLEPVPGTDLGELTVICEYFYEAGDGGADAGIAKEVSYEVEWVVFQRSLFEHPAFSINGTGTTYKLDSQDIADIEAWQNEPNPTLKSAYKYNELAVTGSGDEAELSAAAKMFCRGLELGIENYEDYAPVIRKTTTYVSGLPGTSDAGSEGGEPSFDGKPDGYEWRKSADRAIRAGGQTKWERVEEWCGAIKVLIDKDTIYWTAPG
jgi:hypothetical protein